MKPILKTIFLLCTSVIFLLQSIAAQHKTAAVSKPKLENQIKQYWFVMLTKGSNRSQDSVTAAKIQEGHMANINRLYYAGKLKVAGPFGDDGDWLGLFVFDCATKEVVEQLLKTDPAVAAGRLNYDIRPWWTAAKGSFYSRQT
jgi:uncharacterized protein YciI